MREHATTTILTYNVGFDIKFVLKYEWPETMVLYPETSVKITHGSTIYGTCKITTNSFIYTVSDASDIMRLIDFIAFG